MPTRFEPMATSPMSTVIQRLGTALERDQPGMTDGELLNRFLREGDGAALAAVVRRHAPMVWGVCRRLLRSYHDAEDAFQATFLVLVRKGASLGAKELVANWLYGVAHQTAVRLRVLAAKRGVRERQMIDTPEPVVTEPSGDDLLPLLDQELHLLPQRFRVLIVLCDLEGKTRKEAARQLGCPEGTVASRLARARALLARRFARHGLAVSSGALAVLLSKTAALAGLPTAVVASTIKAATLLATGQATGAISAPVATLTEGVLKTMLLHKLKIATMTVLLWSSAVLACGLLAAVYADGTTDRGPPRWLERQADVSAVAAAQEAKGFPELLVFKGHGASVLFACFSPDGKRLASASADQTVKVWDSRSGQELLTLKGHTDGVHCVCFSPDGQRLASASHDQTVKVWKCNSGRELLTLKGHASAVTSVCFSPDGKRLASVSGDGMGKVWDARTGQELLTLKGEVASVSFSPDGDRLVAGGGFTRTVKVWDLKRGQEVLTLKGHTDYVRCACFSRDERRVASGSFDKTVKVWEVKSGQELLTLKGHADRLRSVSFSPDGQWLASAAGFDTTVKVWDVRTGQEVVALRGHTSHVGSVSFSPDGRRLASASFDRTVRVWDVHAQIKARGNVPAAR
jgi:RNA polymerase sigma factor (sigma-70 family)